MTTTTKQGEILECGHEASEHGEHTTGYGYDDKGKRLCYECCAKRDVEHMTTTGKIMLYLGVDKEGKRTVCNWPGSLKFAVGYVRKGMHNMARVRYDFHFTGPENRTWAGVQYGDNTQIAHCRRIKG